MTALARVEVALEAHDCRRQGRDWQCPAHDDKKASLCVSQGEKGAVLACHAGCETADVVAALGLKMSDLFDEPSANGNGHREIVATYQYVDESGRLLYEVVRFAPKDFRQRRPDGSGGWAWKLGNTRRVLYRLPAAIEAVKTGKPVYIVEGEKDVHALEGTGVVATCNPGGAGKWRAAYNEFFLGARVTIVADRDAPGRKHAAEVAQALDGIAAIIEVRESPTCKDIAEHLAAGLTLGDLVPVADDVSQRPSVTASPSVTENTASQSQCDGSDACDGTPTGEGERLAQADLRPTSELLRDVATVLGRYVVLPSDAARDCIPLYVLHTWAVEGAHATPYLLVLSPEKQAGKSRLLETLELLVREPWLCLSASEAALFRRIEQIQPTLLLDEVDSIFRSSSEATEPLRAVLNGGNRRGASAARCVGKGTEMEVRDFAIFCCKTIAGIDTGFIPDTIVDRSIPIHMQRRLAGEPVQRLRMRFAEQQMRPLRAEMERWAAEHVETLAAAEPALPEELSDRQADGWEPLLAIADLAGGDWPQRARATAVKLASEDVAASRSTILLAAIRDILGDATAIFTSTILEHANGDTELPFGGYRKGMGLDARGLGRMLKPYALKPRTVRVGSTTAKGYTAEQLSPVFDRYLRPHSQGASQASHPSHTHSHTQQTPPQSQTACDGNVPPSVTCDGYETLGDELAAFYGETSR